MKNKIIAVLFCLSLVTACDQETPIFNGLPPVQTGVGVPSFTITRDFIIVDDTASISMDIDSLVQLLLSGAKIETPYFIFSAQAAGPGKLIIPARVMIPLRKEQTSEATWNIIPEANAKPPGKNPSVTISGNASCHFPFNDNEPITLRLTNLEEGKWYCIGFPTNTIKRSNGKVITTMGAAAWVQISAGQIAVQTPTSTTLAQLGVTLTSSTSLDYVFNGPTSVYYGYSSLTEIYSIQSTWNLPPSETPHQYYFTVRESSSSYEAKAYFNILQ